MYDIRQFRPVLYVVLALGLTGFALSAEMPGLWLFSMGLLGLNAWLMKSRRFRPLPRLVTNVTTLGALLFVVLQIGRAGGPPLMFIGQFLVLLHFIKLFEDRPPDEKKAHPLSRGQLFEHANRDYGQMLVLSLLLMVAASINTASLLFGTIMLAYLVLALYCCLLFHLKVEADRARKALAIPEEKISPLTLKQDQRFLPRSMRRLTGLITVHAVVAAVLTFLFFPRGPGQGVLGQLQFRGRNPLVGFSDKVSFDQINDIKQNDAIVAHLSVWHNGKPVLGTEMLYLRGYTLDRYGFEPPRTREEAAQSKPKFTRRPQWRGELEKRIVESVPQEVSDAGLALGELSGDIWKQHFILRPTGSRYLFAMPGLQFVTSDLGPAVALVPSHSTTLRYFPNDQSMMSDAAITGLEYDVYSSNSPQQARQISEILSQALMDRPTSDPQVLDEIRKYTTGPDGPLPGEKPQALPLSARNGDLARKIEHFLRTNFTYTLNLTTSRSQFNGIDPNLAFLTRVKKGHCEYFASAMTLMCQSLGIPARMVVGFRCSEFNVVGGYYIVREADAHTWVEVRTETGWETFDPTSGREERTTKAATTWQSIKHFFDYLEYKWATNVVAYDTRDRNNMIQWMDSGMTNAAIQLGELLRKTRDLPLFTANETVWEVALDVLLVVVGLMVACIVVLVVWFLIQQRRLKRRAARIGLDGLPLDQQLRLARQLAFYDQLTRLLQRHDIRRPRFQTHREFAASLVYLPAEAFDTIKRLTELLYHIRFGGGKLNPHRQRRLETVVARLNHCFSPHFRRSG